MLSRARRVADCRVTKFEWPGVPTTGVPTTGGPAEVPPAPAITAPLPEIVPAQVNLAELERQAFAQGYEQGERAGADAARTRVDAMLGRLGQSIEELTGLRRQVLAQTERQVVQIALAIARRIIHREVAADPELMTVAVRTALQRIGPSLNTTVRLNPEDWMTATRERTANWAGDGVTVVADASVSRGGCHVESDAGFVDGSVEAQIEELSRAMLDDDTSHAAVAVRHVA